MRLGIAVALVMLMSSSALADDSTRISTTLQGYRYNDVLNQYTPGATFAEFFEKNKSKSYLMVEVEMFGYLDQYNSVPNKAILRFLEKEVPSYLAVLDKYDEWRSIALQRGDQIEKVIGKVKQGRGKILVSFFSGNAKEHYLVLTGCYVGMCLHESSAFFKKENVDELRQLLIALQAGELKAIDIDAIYKWH